MKSALINLSIDIVSTNFMDNPCIQTFYHINIFHKYW